MDRVSITNAHRDFVDKLKKQGILGFDVRENIDSYLLAVALGINQDNSQPEKNKVGFIQFTAIGTSGEALMKAALLGTANSDKEYEEYANFESTAKYCDQCSEIGYTMLKNIIDKKNWDEDLIEAFLMRELDKLYKKNIEVTR